MSIHRPSAYGAEKTSMLRPRLTGPLGDALRRLVPVVFPGTPVPVEAFVGFTAISMSPNEDMGDAPVNNSMREIGYFNTEAGARTGPSPNARGIANYWNLAESADVRAALGRPASRAPNAWRVPGPGGTFPRQPTAADLASPAGRRAIEEQAAVGLVSLKRHRDATVRMVTSAARPSDPNSVWAIFLAFMGFSAGDTGASRVVNRYAVAISRAANDRAKLAAFMGALIAEAGALPAAGRPAPWDRARHGNPAYSAMRTLQKLAAGKALTSADTPARAWFPDDAPAAAELTLVAAATGGATAPPPPPEGTPGSGRDATAPVAADAGGRAGRAVMRAALGAAAGAAAGIALGPGAVLGAAVGSVLGAASSLE